MSKKSYYQKRINKAVAYINEHLEDEIRINQLAREANFSSFHFQRIYKALQRETPYDTLLRLRLEKAVFLLRHHPGLKISNIAFECGFPSIENFSRQFKSRYNFTASTFRKDKNLQISRIYQEDNPEDLYTCPEKDVDQDATAFRVEIEELESIPIAYIRGIFGDDGSELVKRYLELIAWAEKHRVIYQGELTRFGMSMDNPDVTPAGKYRYDFGIRVINSYEAEELIEFSHIPAGKYATLHVKGKIHDVANAWDFLYKNWLANSDYIPKHQPAIEEFIQGPEEIGWVDFNIKCRVAVESR